jgi:hypothetical protein
MLQMGYLQNGFEAHGAFVGLAAIDDEMWTEDVQRASDCVHEYVAAIGKFTREYKSETNMNLVRSMNAFAPELLWFQVILLISINYYHI